HRRRRARLPPHDGSGRRDGPRGRPVRRAAHRGTRDGRGRARRRARTLRRRAPPALPGARARLARLRTHRLAPRRWLAPDAAQRPHAPGALEHDPARLARRDGLGPTHALTSGRAAPVGPARLARTTEHREASRSVGTLVLRLAPALAFARGERDVVVDQDAVVGGLLVLDGGGHAETSARSAATWRSAFANTSGSCAPETP